MDRPEFFRSNNKQILPKIKYKRNKTANKVIKKHDNSRYKWVY